MRHPGVQWLLLVAALLGGTASSALGQYKLTWPTNLPSDPPPGYYPPAGYDQPNPDVAGSLEHLKYAVRVSTPLRGGVISTRFVIRTAVVYKPQDYTPKKSYPVLYLMHGMPGTQDDWTNTTYIGKTAQGGSAQYILDNLTAQGKITPMIVVMPDNNSAELAPSGHAAYRAFEDELLGPLITTVDKTYSTIATPAGRALAGLSEGAEQAIYFGFRHLDTFSCIGAFSPGNGDLLDTVDGPPSMVSSLVAPDPIPNISNLRLFWLSCGDQDKVTNGRISAPKGMVTALNNNDEFIDAYNAPFSYSVQFIRWGDGSGVTKKGKGLVLVGTDIAGLLHIRIFDGRGKLVIDTNESLLPAARAFEIVALKRQLATWGVGHVFGPEGTTQVITEVSSIVSDQIPVLNVDLRLYSGAHEWKVWKDSLYSFLRYISEDEAVF